jgi:hypothetical protein
VLYDRDPEHLQAQWYVTAEELAQARRLFSAPGSDLRQVLRLCRLDQDGRAEVVASAPQGPGDSQGEGQDTFFLQGDGADYQCELGLESRDGGWLLLARSNRICLRDRNLSPPRTAPGMDAAEVPGPAGRGESRESPGLPVEPALAAFGGPLFPVFPNLEPEEAPTGEGPPPWKDERGQASALDRNSQPPAGVALHPAPEQGILPSAPPDFDLAAMPPPLLPSTPAPQRPPGLLGVLYDPRAALSSAALQGVEPQEADIEIHAELILYGHARPGSRIDLFGHRLQVGADGRFSFRRSVEDPLLLSLVLGHRAGSEQAALDRG